MAKRPTSRFETIFRQELNSGKGAISSLGTAISESQKEKRDVRNMLPKSGILGAILEKQFGKSYKYAGPKGPSIQSKSATAQAASSRIMAKNSMFLPIIAKDMNIMRQNIQMMAKKQGLKPKTRVNYGKSLTPEPNPSIAPSTSGPAAKSGMFGGITDTLGSIGGGVLGLGGAIISGLIGTIGSIGGAFLSGLTAMTGFGLPGIIGLIAGGYVIYSLAKSINFKKIGTDLYSVFGDAFDGISKSLKEFFGIKEGETFMTGFARKLDETFNTTFFSKNLNKASKSLEDTTDLIGTNLKSAFNTIMAHGLAAAKTLGDVMIAVGKDIMGYTRQWMDQNKDTIYVLIGAALGGVIGSPIAGVGAILGAAIGAGAGKAYAGLTTFRDKDEAKRYEKKYEGKEGAIKQLESQIEKGAGIIQLNTERGDDAPLNLNLPDTRRWWIEYASLRGEGTPAEIEKNIKDGKYAGLTIGRIRDLMSRDERVLRMLDPQKEMKNLENLDFEKVYAKNLALAKSTIPESDSNLSRATGAPLSNFNKRTITSEYGDRKNPVTGLQEKHGGIDISGKAGESVYSAIDGKVIKSGFADVNGNHIFIQGPDGTITKYLHLQEKSALNVGDVVTAGQVIGKLGSTGRSTGSHLHFEVAGANGKTIDPMPFLKNIMTGSPVVAVATTPKPSVTTTAAEEKRKQELADPYAGKSDVELLLAAFGTMFGDLATSILELADAGNKQAAASAGTNKGGSEKVSSASALNYELIASEVGLLRVLKGGDTG